RIGSGSRSPHCRNSYELYPTRSVLKVFLRSSLSAISSVHLIRRLLRRRGGMFVLQLTDLVILAREMHFVRAADRCSVTQSTLSAIPNRDVLPPSSCRTSTAGPR